MLDCNFLCNRAFHAMGDMSFRDMGTGVIFGFLSAVLDLGHQFKTNRFVFCWDSKYSHRKKIYPEYKANRKLDDKKIQKNKVLFPQMKLLRLWATPAITNNTLIVPGYEADDLIMACCYFAKPGEQVVTITADEDLYQVLQLPNNKWYNPIKPLHMSHGTFVKQYGIEPNKWALVKAMAGDTSDNIKGIPGVGKTYAIKYIQGVLGESTAAFKKIREAIEEPDQLNLDMELIKLPFNCVNDSDLTICSRLHFRSMFLTDLLPVFEKFGLESFLKGKQRRRWEKLFDGDFSKEASPVRFKKRKR